MYPEMYPDGFRVNFDMTGFVLVVWLISMAVSIAVYVMQSISLYSIANRRGIRNPWLAWLPVGDAWILGCISDQYRYVSKSQIKNKRKALLILNILLYAAYIAIVVVAFSMIGQMVLMGEDPTTEEMAQMMGALFGMVGLYLVFMGIAIAVAVVRYMALYDLYASCEPSNAAMYLVLSIFISITMPIFLLVCRKKDLGMPPRKQPVEPVQAIPEPWTNTEE